MTEYQRGYLDGYRDARADVKDVSAGERAGEQEAERVMLAEMVEGVEPDPVQQSGYWLGYYHGKGHYHGSRPGAGAVARGEVPPGL